MFTEVEKALMSIIAACLALLVVVAGIEDPKMAVAAETTSVVYAPIETANIEYNIEKFTNPVAEAVVPPHTDATQQQIQSDNPIPSVAPATGDHLTKRGGVFDGPSGKETWYSLDMTGVIRIMRGVGYDEERYPYTVDDDGIKRFGGFVMIAANLELRPRGTIIMTSWGEGIVCDTGAFCQKDKTAIDIATNWSGR